jgi:hypothetical protein
MLKCFIKANVIFSRSKMVILIYFLHMEWWTRQVPDTRLKPDGFGYQFLPVGMGTCMKFYPQLIGWQEDICSTHPEPDPLPSLLERV